MNRDDREFYPEMEDGDDLEMDWYYEELLDYVRDATEDQESINDLLDQDILYLYELWDEFVTQIEDEADVVEIDGEDFYQFVVRQSAEDEQDLNISMEDMLLLVQLQQDFDDDLDDED